MNNKYFSSPIFGVTFGKNIVEHSNPEPITNFNFEVLLEVLVGFFQ